MRYVTFAAVNMFLIASLFSGCSRQESSEKAETAVSKTKVQVSYETPAPLEVPERIKPQNEDDWAARVNNKNAEIVEVLNILNPVAAYLTAAFEQHGDHLSQVTHDEWDDTVAQLTRANKLYEDSKSVMEKKQYNKKLFLSLEEAWQIYVKVGVAGVRTKTMVDAELEKMG